MKEIPLTRGMVALVDDEDYEWLSAYRWYARPGYQTFYAVRGIQNGKSVRTIYMHREIIHPEPGMHTDHLNHNGLDNRRCNLRSCTHQENLSNCVLKRPNEYRGVQQGLYTWTAYVTTNGKPKYLGAYGTPEHAAYAYNLAVIAEGLEDLRPLNDVLPQPFVRRNPRQRKAGQR